MHFFSSPNLLIIQSRLYSPGYGGPGRWVIMQPKTRKAFSAIGPDVIPPVIAILAMASAGVDEEAILHTISQTTQDQLKKLEEVGLLVRDTEPVNCHSENMVWHYHLANYDYPFFDYADSTWRDDEDKIIKAYASMWSPPAPIDTYEGQSIELPPATVESLVPGNELSLETLATILNYTFAPIGKIPTQAITCIRRTSPSGGARHPTECRVILPEGCDKVPPGVYDYDNGNHALVTSVGVNLDDYRPFADTLVIFVIHSKVERAMWRYRDIRALRPVLLDAGHIIETLSLLLAKAGLASHMSPPPFFNYQNFDWLTTPALAALSVSSSRVTGTSSSEGTNTLVPTILNLQTVDEDEFLTNPAFFMKFSNGGLRGFSVWPERVAIGLDLLDFRVLSHCLPSNRGDRSTTEQGIQEAVSDLKHGRVIELLKHHALLPRKAAEALYTASKLWVRYGWYLSELVHLETVSALRFNKSWYPAVASRNYLETLTSLFKRKTSREFAPVPITLEKLEMLLREVLAEIPLGMKSGLRTFVASLDVLGLTSGLYEWRGHLEASNTEQIAITRSMVRQLTVGQFPAGSGSAIVWLTRRLDITEPATYELNIIEMGRIGQRICLIATDLGLGVFLTPAVSDSELGSTLGIDDTLSTISYLFSIGIPK